jgi:hypothetical protein
VYALNVPPEETRTGDSMALRFQGIPYGFGPVARRQRDM